MIGEELRCQGEECNPRDPYAVAVIKSRTKVVEMEVVGHIPHYISTLCSLYIRKIGVVYCIVTGSCRYPRDLPQGGMEIPYEYRFVGNSQDMKEIQSYISNHPAKGLLSTSDSPSSLVPKIKLENKTSYVFATCPLVQKADLKCAGSSTNHSKESMKGKISTDVLSSNDPAANIVNDDHKEASIDVKDKKEIIYDSSVLSGMNALEKILTVTDDDSGPEEIADAYCQFSMG